MNIKEALNDGTLNLEDEIYYADMTEEEYKQEIERLNNIINKKEQFLGDNIKRLEREVVKRDNIINELEKALQLEVLKTRENSEYNKGVVNAFNHTISLISQLKGEDKE